MRFKQYKSREERHRETYSKQDPIYFLKSNSGEQLEDGSWIMHRDLILRKKSPIVKNGKFIVKIREVKSNFNCSYQGLTTLKNGPEKVGGNFWCAGNNLKSLIHGPKIVEGLYDCSYNKLNSLLHIPEKVYGELNASHNNLKHLKHFPTILTPKGFNITGNNLDLSYNKLTSLEGIGNKINVFFYKIDFSNNLLTTMKGLPKEIISETDLSNNKLTSLEGMPVFHNESYFNDNPLETLKGFVVPLHLDKAHFDTTKITKSEIDFILHMQHVLKKSYKRYHNYMFNRIIETKTIEDIPNIKWPKNFLNKKRLNIIKSMNKVNAFNL